MKLALGMMVKEFTSAAVLHTFLDNAATYGHPVDRVILACSHGHDPEVLRQLEKRIPVSLLPTGNYRQGTSALARAGLSGEELDPLLHCELLSTHGLAPYGFGRNLILMEALLSGMEVLVFVDSDVYPCLLQGQEGGDQVEQVEVDFFGRHISALNQGADVTTSDYSGYNILPPARFPGQEALLYGLCKETMTPFWLDSPRHHCLCLHPPGDPKPHPTTKLLGGNLALRLSALDRLPPFFSPTFPFEGRIYLARGEDTLWGMAAARQAVRCVDIDTPIFHDTYASYPTCPDLRRDPAVKDRFFYACTGWIGRNAFFRGLGTLGRNEEGHRLAALKEGSLALYRYTGDSRFAQLPQIAQQAGQALPQMLDEHRRVEAAWAHFIRRYPL